MKNLKNIIALEIDFIIYYYLLVASRYTNRVQFLLKRKSENHCIFSICTVSMDRARVSHVLLHVQRYTRYALCGVRTVTTRHRR
jgi:hypothetical protein